MSAEPTADDVARAMAAELAQAGYLDQDHAVVIAHDRFGEAFIYYNDEGGTSLRKDVLEAFRKLTPDAVWVRSERHWRLRQEGDRPGRMQ